MDVLKPAKFKGSEQDLYKILGIGYDAEHNNRTALLAVNSKMTNAREAANRLKLTGTMLMPDEHTREAHDKQFHQARGIEMSNVHGVFKMALGYIELKWASDKDLMATKKNQAGYAHYEMSNQNYGGSLQMITDLISFIADNSAAMTDGGMPSTFPTTCTSAKGYLSDSDTAYTGQLEISRTLTNDKMTKKNELYDDYQLTHTAAESAVFTSETTINLFSYSVQFEIIHPPHQVKQVVAVKEASHKDIHNAVFLKDIKNIGTEVQYMYDLDKPINDANKITFNPGDLKQNIYSKNLRFVNLSTHSKGSMELFREVHT